MKRSFSNFGFSTILISFVMICIVTFSVLSVMTANSDYKLSQKTADQTQRYYKAEESAYEILAEIDRLISQVYDPAMEQTLYYDKVSAALQSYQKENPSLCLTEEKGQPYVSFTISISETQTLFVSLTVCYPPNSGGVYYQLTSWQTITDMPTDQNTTLNLIGNND